MKSKQNRSERAEEQTQTKDTTKSADTIVKKKKKKRPISKEAEEELTDANTAKAAKDEVEGRITKYIYPADVKTAKAKKDWRRKARAQVEAFTKKINKLTKSKDEADQKELRKVEKEFDTWKAEHLNAQD